MERVITLTVDDLMNLNFLLLLKISELYDHVGEENNIQKLERIRNKIRTVLGGEGDKDV